MQRATVLLLALATVSGCKKGDGIVVLTVTAAPSIANLTLLHVSATAAGRTVTFDDHPAQPFSLPPSRTLGIEFPSSVAGTMKLHVEAQASSGVVATGDVTATTTAGVRSNVSITLGIGGSHDMAGGGGDGGGMDMTGGGSHDMASCGMVTTCTSNDNCCPAGCNQTTDSDCASVCGNNVTEAGEVCDDGNSVNGDNCDPTCQFTNTLTLIAGVADGIGRADGDTTTVRLGGPQGFGSNNSTTSITTDGGNFNMWFGDRCAVKWYDTSLSKITTIAGADGICDTAKDDAGTKARFSLVSEVEYVPNGGTGVLYVTGDPNLRKIDLGTMLVSTIATVPAAQGTFYGSGLSHDATYLYLVDGANGLRKMQLSNNAVTTIATNAQLGNTGQCYDVIPYNGAFYVACDGGIFKVVPGATPTVTTYVAGDSTSACKAGTLANANLGTANRIIVDSQGGLTVTDGHCNVVWYVTASGAAVAAGSTAFTAGHADSMTSPTLGTLSAPTGLVYFSATASTYVVDTGNREIRSYSNFGLLTRAGVWGDDGSTDLTVTGAKPIFSQPFAVLPNGDGTATVAELLTGFVVKAYKLNLMDNSLSGPLPSGGLGGIVIGDAMYGTSPNNDYTIWKYPLSGSPGAYFAGTAHAGSQPNPTDGTLTSATLDNMVAFSTDGTNLYFADGVGGTETLVRMIDIKAGMVVTLAGTLGTTDIVDDVGPKAHFVHINAGACDGPNLYFADNLNDINGTDIRKVEIATRKVTTLAGDPVVAGAVDATGSAARFALVRGLATDGKALYAMDAGNGPFVGSNPAGDVNGPTVREIELPSGRVTTMVGTRGQWTFRPGVGTAAAFNQSYTIAFDTFTHSLIFADYAEDVIVRIK